MQARLKIGDMLLTAGTEPRIPWRSGLSSPPEQTRQREKRRPTI